LRRCCLMALGGLDAPANETGPLAPDPAVACAITTAWQRAFLSLSRAWLEVPSARHRFTEALQSADPATLRGSRSLHQVPAFPPLAGPAAERGAMFYFSEVRRSVRSIWSPRPALSPCLFAGTLRFFGGRHRLGADTSAGAGPALAEAGLETAAPPGPLSSGFTWFVAGPKGNALITSCAGAPEIECVASASRFAHAGQPS